MEQQPLACNINAFTAEQRVLHDAAAHLVFSNLDEMKELSDGYAFRLPVLMWQAVVDFVGLERLCCPFLNFNVQLSNTNTLWLSLTGPEGVKALLITELGLNPA